MTTTEHLTQDRRRNRAPPAALLVQPSTSSVRGDLQEVVCAVNSNSEEDEEEEGSDEGHNDTFRESSLDGVVTTTIPHLWTDMPIAGPSPSSSSSPSIARVNGQASAATMSISTLDHHHHHQQQSAADTFSSAASTTSTAIDTIPSSSTAMPSSLLQNTAAGIAGSTALSTSNNDTNTGDTRCTSSCSYASSSWAPSTHLDKEHRFSIVSSTGTSATSEGCHNHHHMISTSEIASKHNSLTGIMGVANSSAFTAASSASQASEVTPTSSAMASSSSLPTALSTTAMTTISTCSAGPSPSSASTSTASASTAIPAAHKRSFLSSVLSRSNSLSGQNRNEALRRTRTISSSHGSSSSNSSSGVYAAASPGLQASSSNSNVHARHASNPYIPISSSSSSLNTATPSSPRRERRVGDTAKGRPSTSSSAAATVVPPPVDSVFSTASKPYIHEDNTQTIGRASSPSSSSSAYGSSGTTPTSRAARYLSRHFTGPASSTNARSESASEETMRRSPTPTIFSSGAGPSGSNTSGTRSTSMPMLSSTSNNSSTSLLAMSPHDSSFTVKSTPKAKEKGKQRPAPASAGPATVPLSTFNLALNPLTPQLSLSRAGQPLCGAVLDEKYLLIGTTLGLDFIPLHREGNRSLRGGIFGNVSSSLSERFGVNTSSSSTHIDSINPSSQHNGTPIGNGITDENLDKKVRKPIPLVKKTRFKQLVILSVRSNVLLAIAGRNDHVRVYSLDTLRKLIEKKMKDIVDSNGPSTASKYDARNNINKGLGLNMPKKVNTPMSGDYKGKGRALPPLASSGQGQSTNEDSNASRQYSPPPAYEHTPTSLASPYPASGDSSKDIPASSRRQLARTSAEQETPSSATSTSFQSISSSSQRGSHSPREHVASSARALRRGKPGNTSSRRASNASNADPTVTSGSSSRSNSRRGSSATVVPDSIARMSTASMYTPVSSAGRRRPSVATIVPTSPTNLTYSSGIQSTITRRGSTAQLADMGQVTSEQHIPRTSLLDGENTEDGSESYEWVDAPEDDSDSNEWTASGSSGYSFPPHPAAPRRNSIPAVPPLPEQYATFASVSTSSVAHARARSASGTSSSTTHRLRMTPRSARTRVETYSEEEDEEAGNDQVDNASVYATPAIGSESEILDEEQEGEPQSPRASTSSSVPLLSRPPTSSVEDERKRKAAQAKKNRRLSLADILNESRADPFQIEDAPPVPTSSRNAFTDPLPSSSRFSDSLTRTSTSATSSAGALRQPVTPRKFEARSATAKSTHGGLSDLADFLSEGPPEPVDTASSGRSTPASTSTSTSPFSLSRPSGFLRRTLTSTSIPEMQQRNRADSPVTTPLLNSRSPSLSSFSTSTSTRTARYTPRDAQILKMDTQELAGRDSLLDLLREGPSQEMPIARATGPPTTPRRASHSRKLQKGQHQSSAFLQSNKSSTSNPATPSLTAQRSASVPQSQMQVGTPAVNTHVGGIAPRHRTRSDGAIMHRNGNYILPADEIVPVPVTVTTPAPTDSFADKTRKRRSLQPRSPTFRQFIAEFDPQPPTIDPDTGQAQQMARGLSLQEMLAGAGSDDTASPVLGSEDDSSAPFAQAGSVAGHVTGNAEAGEGQAQIRNRPNRWSLLNGLRSSPSVDDAAGSASAGRQSESQGGEPVEPRHSTSAERRNIGLPASTAMTSAAPSANPSGLPPVLKPVRPDPLMDDESPPFGNLTPDMQQQLAEGASDPDGTTIMFTQQTTRASGELISTASALNGASAVATSAQSRMSSKVNSAGLQKDPVSGNLEYVKLARTKGSRFIRASETGKRTYLAVLCGDAGERIELFTGAKNVSLSLNRTFVLPETPRTIEFQLQGEDLLDLYLIYDSAIFALEPSTVRVREVGIQRNERRQARRERDRMLRQTEILEGVDTSVPPPSPGSPPSRVARARDATEASETDEAEARPAEGISSQAVDPIQTEGSSSATSRAPSMEEEAGPANTATQSEAATVGNETENTTTTTVSSVVATNATNPETSTPADNTPSSPTSGAPTTPYTTFQQLEFLPQIPPSALASSYIIPPTYETVLSASPNPESNSGMFINSQLGYGAPSVYGSSASSDNVIMPYGSSPELSRSATPSGGRSHHNSPPGALLTPNWRSPTSIQQQQYPDGQTPPLLSPVSLLANPSAKNIGPPGLFFVSKGRTSTGIVDGDGRSVIRKPISWLTASEEAAELPEQYEGLNHFSRLEIILSSTDKTRVCIAAFGPTSVRTIELGHTTQLHSIEVIPYEAFKRQSKSNAMVKTLKNQGKEIPDEMVFVRDVTYLAKAGQCTFFAERVGSNVGIYSLGAAGYTFH